MRTAYEQLIEQVLLSGQELMCYVREPAAEAQPVPAAATAAGSKDDMTASASHSDATTQSVAVTQMEAGSTATGTETAEAEAETETVSTAHEVAAAVSAEAASPAAHKQADASSDSERSVLLGTVFLRWVRTAARLFQEVQQHADFGENDTLLLLLRRQLSQLAPVWQALEQWLRLAALPNTNSDNGSETEPVCLSRRQICAALHGAHVVSTLEPRYWQVVGVDCWKNANAAERGNGDMAEGRRGREKK